MHIVVSSEKELKEIAAKFLHISVNLRHWTKLWNEHFGGYYLTQKKRWEKLMDEFLEELGAEKVGKLHEVHISIKDNESNTSIQDETVKPD
jgi:hypothetical protein